MDGCHPPSRKPCRVGKPFQEAVDGVWNARLLIRDRGADQRAGAEVVIGRALEQIAKVCLHRRKRWVGHGRRTLGAEAIRGLQQHSVFGGMVWDSPDQFVVQSAEVLLEE